MAKTKFINAETKISASFLNKVFGGLSTSDGIDADDPLVKGHIHDGIDDDGHVGKISLVDHVEGELQSANLADAAVTTAKIEDSAITTAKIVDNAISTVKIEDEAVTLAKLDPSIDFGGGPTDLNPVTKLMGMSNSFPVQIGVDGSGNIAVTPTTIIFPAASEDMLIKKIVTNVVRSINGGDEILSIDTIVFLSEIRVNGTPIDSGVSGLMSVYGFGKFNPIDLNLPLVAGDLLEIDVNGNGGDLAGFAVTWEPLPATLPTGVNTFLGVDGLFAFIPVGAGAVAATGSFTVDSVPHVSDSITLTDFVSNNVSLQGSNGPRTSGSNDYDNTIATTTDDMAIEMAAAINDPSNDFDNVTAVAVGSDVNLTYAVPGFSGNYSRLINNITEVTIASDYFTGGTTGGTTTVTYDAVPADGTVRNIAVYSIIEEISDVGFEYFLAIEALRINGGTNLLEEKVPCGIFGARSSRYSPNLDIPVTTGDVITVEITNGAIFPTSYLSTIIVELD